MRRPNRSIEVFDISLMAVVTKAMGAFLVLMLLLMPYYSSGPVGEQNAAALTQTIADAQKELDLAVQKLTQSKPDPKEIARLLDEVLKRLREAQELIARLKRDNDALNGQVKRLEENLQEAEAENEALQKELAEQRKIIFSAQVIGWDCLDVRFDLVLLPRQDELFTTTTKENKKVVINQILNFSKPATGGASTVTDDAVLAKFSEEKTKAPGENLRFNTSQVYARLNNSQVYLLALLTRDKKSTKIQDYNGYALKKPSKNCEVILIRQYIDPETKALVGYYTGKEAVKADSYGLVLNEIHPNPKGSDVTLKETLSEETKKWWKDQIDRSAKVEADSKPVNDRAAILRTVEGWTVPADKGACQILATRATQIQIDAKAYNNNDRAGMAAVTADCNAGQFASALQKLKAEMRRTIK